MPAPWYDPQFGQGVLRGMGVKPTPAKMRFLQAWAQAEGTKAQYNPFATTRKGYQGETNFNSVGVKNYANRQQGIKATVDTLSLDYYTNIVNLLRTNDVTAEQLARAVAESPWGTGAGVLRVLGVTQSDGYEKTKSTAQYGLKKGQLEQQYQTVTLDRFRPSEGYLQTLERMGQSGAPALRLAGSFTPFTKTEAIPGTGPQMAPDGMGDAGPATYPSGFKGKTYYLPMSQKGTHPTDNLGWGSTSAVDIMLKPGTPVGAPEAGTIIRLGSAQGGSSLYFKGKSGKTYWLGHIDNIHQAGTRVKRGQVIARISADHPRPHAHWDTGGGGK